MSVSVSPLSRCHRLCEYTEPPLFLPSTLSESNCPFTYWGKTVSSSSAPEEKSAHHHPGQPPDISLSPPSLSLSLSLSLPHLVRLRLFCESLVGQGRRRGRGGTETETEGEREREREREGGDEDRARREGGPIDYWIAEQGQQGNNLSQSNPHPLLERIRKTLLFHLLSQGTRISFTLHLRL